MARKSKLRNPHSRTLIARDQVKSPITEQYRTIRTNMEFANIDQDLKSVLLTSTGPSEGKSLTAANLAIVFAQQGKRVLLIDADLRKPTVHYTFRLNNTFGLSNYLVGDYQLEKVVQQTNVESLDIMTCGPIPPNPSELLGSKAMKSLLKESNDVYDLVVFDTPPVLAVTDSQILANLVDGVLLVVRSKQTEKEAAKKAKDLLNKAEANILGAVLNDRDIKDGGYYYYYGN
ncbi:CpsD/CapB family tyrosine-protein kinase [Piscibacillus salipiscarius]|uniref:non-specific protein-tyrosine kinase n=1 Tax=Piscibacillus salipiscarius TaxID=299480 RepID=A0ABW5QBZ7_9BACI|nr:polysaccharide biosynthesis tyrosine autokinase [Piscibacillus salipiscarius]